MLQQAVPESWQTGSTLAMHINIQYIVPPHSSVLTTLPELALQTVQPQLKINLQAQVMTEF